MIQPRLAAQHDIPVDDGNPHRHAVDFYDPEAKRPRLAIVNRAVDKRLESHLGVGPVTAQRLCIFMFDARIKGRNAN
jgi:hypothetical protein